MKKSTIGKYSKQTKKAVGSFSRDFQKSKLARAARGERVKL